MPTAFTFTGLKEMSAELTGLTGKTYNAMAEALRVEALSVLTIAKDKYVPEKSGTLRDSGQVHQVTFDNTSGYMMVMISFGSGASKPYAEAVHEYPSKFSPPSWQNAKNPPVRFHPDGHGPKFLDIPLKAAQQNLKARVAMRVRLAMG